MEQISPTAFNFDPNLILAISAIFLLQAILIYTAYWKLFLKAGKPGWAILVPIYNVLVILQIVKKPWWWLLLMFIPFVGSIWAIWAFNLFIKAFGKNEGYTVASLFFGFIFLPILAFDKSTQYIYVPSREINDIGTTTY